MDDILINESFSNENFSFEDIKNNNFGSDELLKLKIEANEVSNETEINELISYTKIKKNLTYELPHQTEGALRILRDFSGNALLADEVGLGKTITTGLILKECIERGFVKKALILTPPSLVDQWVSELHEKFELDFNIIEDESDWKNNFVIASIDRVKIFDPEKGDFRHNFAHQIPWDLLIVDEAHKLKDRRTMRWRFVDKIKKKRFLILTATPFQNDLLELYNLLHLLKRGHLGTINQFRSQFLDHGNKRIPMNPKDLKRKLDEVMVRRRRDEAKGVTYMKRIPKIVAVDLTKEEQDIYEAICDLLKTKYFASSGKEINGKLAIYALLPKVTSSSMSAIESLTKIAESNDYHEETKEIARRILDSYKYVKKDSKIEKLIEIITNIFKEDPTQKILIYTKYPTTLRYIKEKLSPFNLKIVEFMGGQDREGRTKIIKEFKENANILISTETGAEGLNFQFCNNLINYDLPWNPMSVEQRIGRLDRIGQKRDMSIYSLATKGTMEEHVVDLIINKMCCIGLVIGELPIILFNLGLDGNGGSGINKIEEMLMNKFIDSKNNLEIFSKGVKEIEKIIEDGIESYKDSKILNSKLLDSE